MGAVGLTPSLEEYKDYELWLVSRERKREKKTGKVELIHYILEAYPVQGTCARCEKSQAKVFLDF